MSRLLDKEYREMYADIKPSGLLIAEVKEKMKKEPDLKKASLRKISLWCGSAGSGYRCCDDDGHNLVE